MGVAGSARDSAGEKMGQENTLPLTDETFQPGEVMSEVFSEDELKAGDVIRLWSDDLPYLTLSENVH